MKRLHFLDTLRGLAIINVLIFHLCYDWQVLWGGASGWPDLPGVSLWQRVGCGLFIALGGMAFHLSAHNLRRGLELNLLGLLITGATCLLVPAQAIYCGILNFFGCAIWLTVLLRGALRRLRPAWGMAAAVLLYLLTQDVAAGTAQLFTWELWRWPSWLYRDALAVCGFHGGTFHSADYAPLLPQLFLFWFSWYLFAWLRQQELLRYLSVGRLPLVGWAGRHSLAIYLLHQPLLLALGECAALLC